MSPKSNTYVILGGFNWLTFVYLIISYKCLLCFLSACGILTGCWILWIYHVGDGYFYVLRTVLEHSCLAQLHYLKIALSSQVFLYHVLGATRTVLSSASMFSTSCRTLCILVTSEAWGFHSNCWAQTLSRHQTLVSQMRWGAFRVVWP